MNKIAYLSVLAKAPLTNYLKNAGYDIFSCSDTNTVYPEISTHADIIMCQMGLWENSHIFSGNTSLLKNHYPGNIIYNAVCTGKYFIHNLKHTNADLLNSAESLEKIHVSQGYTRCSCLPVDDSSFITSDAGIASALEKAGVNVLIISPGNIRLPGFDYGFIGGTAGGIITAGGRRTMIFNGNLSEHPDHEKIAAFIESRDIDIVYFPEYPLEDIGSILTERR